MAGLPARKVDSEWALEQIIALGGIEPALPVLKDHTKSALNLLVLTIGRQKETPALLNYFHYFKPNDDMILRDRPRAVRRHWCLHSLPTG